MDLKYARFVAYGTLVAHEYLRKVLRNTQNQITPNLLRDAARIGAKEAKNKIFPGLVRTPFNQNPADDIVLGLKYHYEAAGHSPSDTQWDAKTPASLRGKPATASEYRNTTPPPQDCTQQKAYPFAPRSTGTVKKFGS